MRSLASPTAALSAMLVITLDLLTTTTTQVLSLRHSSGLQLGRAALRFALPALRQTCCWTALVTVPPSGPQLPRNPFDHRRDGTRPHRSSLTKPIAKSAINR